MSTQILWFATRGSGVVSLILFSAVACLGLLAVARASSAAWPRFLTVELHRNLALLSVAFLVIHIVTAVLDPFTSLGFAAAVIPLASSYRPVAVGLGVISVDLALAVIVTSLLRERIGQRAPARGPLGRVWRMALAVAHTITAGSDASAPWMLGIDAACLLAVGACLMWRLTAGDTNRRRLPAVAAGTADPIAIEPAWRND